MVNPKSRSTVRVYVRVRPPNPKEELEARDGPSPPLLQVIGNAVRVHSRKKDGETTADFVFDHCFDSTRAGNGAEQADIYAVVGKEVLANARDGYNACLFAYGQTGSGKTHTMMGDVDGPERGLIPRLCADLFAPQTDSGYAAHTTRVQASYLEIYCERVYDLLSKDQQGDLQVRQHPEKGPFVEGLSTHDVGTLEQVVALLHRGSKNRTTCATLMNNSSSRSHAIFMLNYTQTFYAGTTQAQRVQARSKSSRIYLVDLAGSERTKLSGVSGQNMEEAKKINQSLSTLGRVIDLLADRQAGQKCVLPVRESLLTWLLADSLGGNSKTIMMAAVSPSTTSCEETLSTLRYAARTKCIVNEAFVNETLDLKMVDDLRGQIGNLQELLKNSQMSRDGEISSLEGQLQSAVSRTVELEWELAEARRAAQRAQDEREEAGREAARLQAELSQGADALHHLQVLYDAAMRRKSDLEASLTNAQPQAAELQAVRGRAVQEAGALREELEALRRRSTEAADEHRQRHDANTKEIAALKAALRQSSLKVAELEGTLQSRTEQAARDRQQAAQELEAAVAAARQRSDQTGERELAAVRVALQQLRLKSDQEIRDLREEKQKLQEQLARLQARLTAASEETRGRETAQQQNQTELEQQRTEHATASAALRRSHDAVLADVQQQINDRWRQQGEAQHQKQRAEVDELTAAQRTMEGKMARMANHIRDLQGQVRSLTEGHQQDVQDLGRTIAALHALLQRHEQVAAGAEEQARAVAQRLEATRSAVQREQQAVLQRLPAHLEWVVHPKSNSITGGGTVVQGVRHPTPPRTPDMGTAPAYVEYRVSPNPNRRRPSAPVVIDRPTSDRRIPESPTIPSTPLSRRSVEVAS